MNKPSLILIGAGGHARACIDTVEQEGIYRIAGLVGLPEEVGSKCFGYEVLATDGEMSALAKQYQCALITIGQIHTAEHRIRLYLQAKDSGFTIPTVIAPTAYVSSHAKIGKGTIVMHGVIVNAGAQVGNNCIINTNSLIEHDVNIEDHCHISTGAILNGNNSIGEGVFIGSGSVIKEGVSIGRKSLVGMGLSVRNNLEKDAKFLGVTSV
jgi:sugar O-acyltransferase (sialic acid O-acetyltransferase NeuD family)